VDNTSAIVPFLLMFALIAILIGGLWRQDRDSGLWRNEYIDRPDGAASRPFSEIGELAKMAGVLIVLVLAALGFHLLISS